jgi:hypothetical protein
MICHLKERLCVQKCCNATSVSALCFLVHMQFDREIRNIQMQADMNTAG